jgi:polyphosphate kinase 2 (PPK2 family)
VGRVRQGRRDQAARSRRSTRATCRVAQFAAPTHDEKRHHFLWRFWPVLPGWGGFAVLDRSWYGRVLVERVEGYATDEQWSRAYDEIAEFERRSPPRAWCS